MTITVPIKQIDLCDNKLPFYATKESAGMDLLASIKDNIILSPMQRTLIPTGISIALPPGIEAQIRPRSGLAHKYGLTVLNAPGTIDSDYRGEIKVIIINLGSQDFTIESGMRIAQMVIAKYENVSWNLIKDFTNDANNVRQDKGFGSTGI